MELERERERERSPYPDLVAKMRENRKETEQKVNTTRDTRFLQKALLSTKASQTASTSDMAESTPS